MHGAELQGLPNVILTPHIGGSTEEAQAAIGREVAAALVRFVNRGTSTGAVNFPQVRAGRRAASTSRHVQLLPRGRMRAWPACARRMLGPCISVLNLAASVHVRLAAMGC